MIIIKNVTELSKIVWDKDLGWLVVRRDDFGLCVGFGVGLAGEVEGVVLDNARKLLETLVNGQSHGWCCHLTDDLRSGDKHHVNHKERNETRCTGFRSHTAPHQVAVEHQRLDDGTKASD